MPLINGLKMACEPCIRGHRSTNCQHANERVMVPVRKPGRPLSNCPHPGSRGCYCNVVTAAIPRRQPCRCESSGAAKNPAPPADPVPNNGPSGSAPASGLPVPRPSNVENEGHYTAKTTESSTTTPSYPLASRPPTAPAFRVKKSSPRAPSRKQSTDPSNVDMPDLSQYRRLRALSSFPVPCDDAPFSPPPMTHHIATLTASSMLDFPGGSLTHPPLLVGHGFSENLVYQSAQAPLGPLAGSASNDASTYQSTPASILEHDAGLSSCCSSKNRVPKQRSTSVPVLLAGLSEPARGCCSSKAQPPPVPEPILGPLQLADVAPYGSVITHHHQAHGPSNTQQPLPVQQDPYGSYYSPQLQPNPNASAYPAPYGSASYGSFIPSSRPDQWQGVVSSLSNSRSGPVSPRATTAFDMGAPAAGTSLAQPWNTQAIIRHECNCGPTCQCLGCPTHPHNETTTNYVYSGWISQWEPEYPDDIRNRSLPNIHEMAAATSATAAPTGAIHSVAPMSPSAQLYHSSNAADGGPPTAPETPTSETASGGGDDEIFSAGDFIFVNYPFTGETCGGVEAVCPCGDDCRCLGCTIHGTAGLGGSDLDVANFGGGVSNNNNDHGDHGSHNNLHDHHNTVGIEQAAMDTAASVWPGPPFALGDVVVKDEAGGEPRGCCSGASGNP